MQTAPTAPTPPESVLSTDIPVEPFVNFVADFIVGMVQLVAATASGALLLGIVLLFLVIRVRRHRY